MERFKEKRFFEPVEIDPNKKEKVLGFITEMLSSEDHKIIFAYAHGSFVTSKSFRDIDIALFIEGGGSFTLESDLSAKLTAAVGYDVEVKTINDAPVAFQTAVIRDGLLLFCRDEAQRVNFIERVGRRYREYIHFRNLFLEVDGVRYKVR